MGTKYISNNGADVIYVGGKMILPGEGREVDVMLLPPEHQDAPAVVADVVPSLDDLLQALRAKSIAKITPDLPGMTLEALERLQGLEQEAEAPRKGLLAAISEEQLRRADAALQGDDPGQVSDAAKAAAGEALAAAIAALEANQDPEKLVELQAAVLAAEDAARLAGVIVGPADPEAGQ